MGDLDCYTTGMTDQRASSPRFRRPDNPRAIRVTDDDLEILWHIYRNRLIESDCLYALMLHRSKQGISRRLDRLFDNGYVDRINAKPAKSKLTPGTDHFVYAITNLGARALRDKFKVPVKTERWTDKNGRLSLRNIEHFLETSRFMSRFVAGVQATEGAQVRYLNELLTPEELQKRPDGLQTTLRADVPWPVRGYQEGTAADSIMALDYNNNRQIFFVEIDRGTETIVPGQRQRNRDRFWRDTSFLRKMLIYAAAFKAGEHKRQFGFSVFRVLTVTTQPDRVRLMQEAYENHIVSGANRVAPGLFLFSDWESLAGRDDYLSGPFVNAAGREQDLLG